MNRFLIVCQQKSKQFWFYKANTKVFIVNTITKIKIKTYVKYFQYFKTLGMLTFKI